MGSKHMCGFQNIVVVFFPDHINELFFLCFFFHFCFFSFVFSERGSSLTHKRAVVMISLGE